MDDHPRPWTGGPPGQPSPDIRARPPRDTARRPRVLIVEDEPFVRRILVRALREHELSVAGSGRDALAQIERGVPFDVILCDIMMPRMTGIELYERVSTARSGQEQAFVFLTGGVHSHAAQSFLAGIPNLVLQKPIECTKLRALIAELVSVG